MEPTPDPAVAEMLVALAKVSIAASNRLKENWEAACQAFNLPQQLTELQEWSERIARFSDTFKSAEAAMERLPGELTEVFIDMAKAGWYPSSQMTIPHLRGLGENLKAGKTADVDSHLSRFFDSRSVEIERDLIEIAPHRRAILQAAFNAHRRGEFALSVPVMLAQADGLCYDLDGETSLFWAPRGTSLIVPLLSSRQMNDFAVALFAPLKESDVPISTPKRKRSPAFTGLNRHAVLHGESVDYGTHENGCRAISLLSYIGHFVTVMRESPP